jgi:hypothetical protein
MEKRREEKRREGKGIGKREEKRKEGNREKKREEKGIEKSREEKGIGKRRVEDIVTCCYSLLTATCSLARNRVKPTLTCLIHEYIVFNCQWLVHE